MNKLNTRQWELYNFIKEYSINGEKKNRREIQKCLSHLYPVGNKNLFQDASARLITRDIQAINDSEIIQKIIISESCGIRVANSKEVDEYIKRREIQIKSELKRLYLKKKKVNKHGQGRLPLQKYAREFIESLINEVEDG